jgi:hypothetical protein
MLGFRWTHGNLWALTILVVLALSPAFLLSGCGGCQKEKPPVAPKPAPVQPLPPPPPAPEKAAELTPPQAEAPLGSVVPVTLDVLKLEPESSMVTVAFPPVQGIFDKFIAMAKRVAPPEAVDAAVSKQITLMGQDVGSPDAKNIADVARAGGFNPDFPIAVYADLTSYAANVKKGLEKVKADIEAAKAAKSEQKNAEGDQKKDAAAPAPQENKPADGEQKKDAAAPAPQENKPAEGEQKKGAAPDLVTFPDLGQIFKSSGFPRFAAVAGCADPVKLEATVTNAISLASGYVDPAKVETIDVNGVPVKCYDPEKFAYAIAGDKLVVGTSLEMLKGVLARVNAPAKVRYGRTDCPASSPDEIVSLVKGDKIAPVLQDLLNSLAAAQPAEHQMPKAQLDYLSKLIKCVQGDDPSVATIEWTDKKLEWLTRIDFAKHQALSEMLGEAKPLRLAPLLPESTLLMLSIRLNEQSKKQFQAGWNDALPPEIKADPKIAQKVAIVSAVMGMIGDEVTLGLAGGSGSLPQAFLLVGSNNVDQAKAMIQLYAPMTPKEQYNGVDISTLGLSMPIPFYIATTESTLMICNDVEKLKVVIDAEKNKTPTNLFASLDPPMDLATPRYGALLVKSSLITDVISPLAGFAGGIPPEIQPVLTKIVSNVREIRASRDIVNGWFSSVVTLNMN